MIVITVYLPSGRITQLKVDAIPRKGESVVLSEGSFLVKEGLCGITC